MLSCGIAFWAVRLQLPPLLQNKLEGPPNYGKTTERSVWSPSSSRVSKAESKEPTVFFRVGKHNWKHVLL